MEMQMTIKGLRVINARRPVTVTITPHDVGTGKDKAPKSCAAAKGAIHSIPNCVEARVHLSRVYIKRKDRNVWERYHTSAALRGEILAFDRGGRFEPGEYILQPMGKSERQRKRSGSDTNRNTKRNHVRKPRKTLHVAQGVRHRMGPRGTED